MKINHPNSTISLFIKGIIISLLINVNSYAQIGFNEHVLLDETITVNDTRSVFSVDIDGDGDLDVLSASSADRKIAWYENMDSNGNFGEQEIIDSNISRVETVYAVDIDGDGDMDVLSASQISNRINWYENTNGEGNFGSKKVITTNVDETSNIFAFDIDGDGDMDVLSASREDDKIAWYENTNGRGSFSSQKIISTNADGAESVFAVDIDGDGDTDVLSASFEDDKIAWYENTNGEGSFGTQQIISNQADGAESIFAVDIDGDNDIDVLSASFEDDKIAWYENTNGQGVFSTEQIISLSADGANSVYAIDIDNDGDMDVISASKNDDKVTWYENTNGAGNFGAEQVITVMANGVTSVFANDLDNDGDMDVLSSSSLNDTVEWYENTNGQGNYSDQNIIVSGPVDNPQQVFALDMNGDDNIDIITYSGLDNKIVWFENDDGGNFDSKQHIVIDLTKTIGIGINQIYPVDIDGDGDIDLSYTSSDSGIDKVSWVENVNGQGAFGPEQIIGNTNLSGGNAIFASDIDNDGDMDVFVGTATGGNDKIVWYENTNGQGSFGNQQIITSNVLAVRSLFLIDIDGDLDIDLLSASSFDDKIVWFENIDGKGGFGTEHAIIENEDAVFFVYGDDLDGDGDIDVISSSIGDKRVAWYENTDGKGTFGSQQIIFADGGSYESVFTADIDGDGDKDVISTDALGDIVAWYENIDSKGNFGSQQIITDNADRVSYTYAADFDNDGDMDVVSVSPNDDKIAWYENIGIVANEILSQIQIDVNMNGCTADDPFISNILVTTTDGTDSFSSFASQSGMYQFFPEEGTYTTSLSNIPSYFSSNPVSHNSNFIGIGGVDIANFCLEPTTTLDDLNVSIYPSRDDPRPGFDTFYQIVYNNIGTTQLSGNIVFEFDNTKMQFLSASETIASKTSNELIFDYTGLNPFETRTIDLEFNIFPPPTTNIDDILTTTATVDPVAGDNTSDDNVFTLNQTVIGSYDPNDIRVLEGDQITLEEADNYLHYIIRFQNTGTASAINVNVENVLDYHLDWVTMQLESLSHSGRVEITNGSNVKFIFDDINLPDSTNDEPNSHGFITYKIKPKNSIVVGDIIPNQADIFFDFNPAIITNEVTTEVTSVLNVDKNLISKFSIYPNPTKNVLNIQSKTKIKKLEIYNNIGQVITSELNKTAIDISTLSRGLYYIEIKDVLGNCEIKKVIKE